MANYYHHHRNNTGWPIESNNWTSNNKKRIKFDSNLPIVSSSSSSFNNNSASSIQNCSKIAMLRRTNDKALRCRASYSHHYCCCCFCYASGQCNNNNNRNNWSLMLLMCLIICASHLAPCVLAIAAQVSSASSSSSPSSSYSSSTSLPLSTPVATSTSIISSQAAIVRRLYYSSAPSTAAHSSQLSKHPSLSLSSSAASSSSSLSSPYSYNRTSQLAQQQSRRTFKNQRVNSSAPSGIIRNGVAQITPISLDSTTYVHLSSLTNNNNKNRVNKFINSSTISTSTITSVPSTAISTTTTSTPAPTSLSILTPSTSASSLVVSSVSLSNQSSRQGKSISQSQQQQFQHRASVTNETTPTNTNTSSSSQPETETLSGNYISTESNLCFLSHGGSSETFTVNEATPIGSVIGNIKVFGNASTPDGNIELSIISPVESTQPISAARSSSDGSPSGGDNDESPNSIPIRIEPGTKRLVLARKLDKESVEGESSVTIGVRCRSRKQSRPPQRPKLSQRGQHGSDPNSKLTRKMLLHDEPLSDRIDSNHDNAVENDSLSSNSNLYYSYDTSILDGSRNDIGYGTRDDDDDAIIIPIRILVTDANDNRPEWQGPTPYSVNISEMTSVGSPVLSGIRAVDNDQLGPYSTVEYYVEPGLYSHFFRFVSPLEGTLLLSAPLDYETLPKFFITIRAQDQGNPPNSATTKVEIRVIDADDQNPRFESDKYTGMLADGQRTDEPLSIQPRTIKAEDPDRGIRSPIVYGFNSNNNNEDNGGSGSIENSYFKIDPNSGEISLRRSLSGSVTLPLTLVIRATQLDNRDRYALTTLTIVNRRNQILPELRFLHSNYSTSLLESTPPGTVVLTVQISRLSDSQLVPQQRFQLLDDDEGYFSVRNTGEILVKKFLDYEKHRFYTFRVMVTDGRQSDVARVTVEALNVNEHDPVFGQTSYQFHVNEARLRASPIIGRIQATDADDGDRVQITLSGPHAGAFALAHDGTLRLRSLRLVNSSECHLIATATDSGLPPRSSSASVMVKFSPQLLKSFSGRTLDSGSAFLFANFGSSEDDLLAEGGDDLQSGSSPSATDILQHSANIFTASTNSTALVLVIVLGVLLGTLFIIIVALTLHVLKNRKYKTSPIGSAHHHRHHHHDRHGIPVSSSSFPSSSSAVSTSSSSSSSSSSNLSLNSQYKAVSDPNNPNIQPITSHSHHHQLQHQPASSTTSPPGSVSAKLRPVFFTTGFAARLQQQNQAKVTPTDSLDLEHTHAHHHHSHHLHHLHHHHHAHGGDNNNNKKSNGSQEGSHDSAISSDVSSTSDGSNGRRNHPERNNLTNDTSMIEDRVILDAEDEEDDDNRDDVDRISNESLPPPPPMSPPPNSSPLATPNNRRPDSSSSSSSADLIQSGNNGSGNSTGNGSVLGSRISVVKWPQGSIPRRVKKLTWQDEQRNNHLDQIYQSNSTVPVLHVSGSNGSSVTITNNAHHHQQQLAAKTKTLSGHLLTGTTSVPPPSSQLASYAMRGGGTTVGVTSVPNSTTSNSINANKPARPLSQPPSSAPNKPTASFGTSRDSVTAPNPPTDQSQLHYHHYHPHHHHHNNNNHNNNLHTPFHTHHGHTHTATSTFTPQSAASGALTPSHHHHHNFVPNSATNAASGGGGATLPDLTVYF